MTSKKYQMEWDHSAYYRKFQQTLAYVQIGEAAPAWTWIGACSDNMLVYGDPRRHPIGQFVCEITGGEPSHSPSDYPVVQFFYQPILPGVYQSREAEDAPIYYLMKRHIKSYKIGLSDENFNVIKCWKGHFEYDRVTRHIDLGNPVDSYMLGDNYEVFSRKVVRIGSTLWADGDSIGFMEGGSCMLRHPNFAPLLQPLLGAKWQIES